MNARSNLTSFGILALAVAAVTAAGLVPAQARAQCDPQEIAKLIASDSAADDHFGSYIAVHEDTAVVGAWLDDHASGTGAGSAYVFVRSGDTWIEQAKLTASDAAPDDYFGSAVAIHRDTVVIGAVRDDHAGGVDAGSAYVFVRSGDVWTEQAHLIASDSSAEDLFGGSVAIDGDTVIIGAVFDDHAAGTDAGSAYVFVRSSGVWTEAAKLTAADAMAADFFGGCVAIEGDTALIGAPLDTHAGGAAAGSAYVFVCSGDVWTEQAKLTASDATSYDAFGTSVAIDRDTALIGARFGRSASGSAYVFVRSGTLWIEQATLTASDGAPGDEFGCCVAVDADIAVIGSQEDDHAGGEYAGSAYVFIRSNSTWNEAAKLTASDAAAVDHFGSSVAVSADTALIGAPFDDHAGGEDAGSAYVFDLNCVETMPGDVDGDGDVDLADLAALLSAYGACAGDPDYNPAADFDNSGCINLTDLATLLSHYGVGGV